MTVHFYTKDDISKVAARQRGFLIAQELQKYGIQTVVHAPPVETMSVIRWPRKFFLIVEFVRSLLTIKKGDVVFLQRTIGNKYFFVIMVLYLRLFRRKMIFDFDDAIYLHTFFKTKVFTQMADAVFICSTLLRDWVKQYNSNVYIFHTSVSFAWYQQYSKKFDVVESPVRIGWVGKADEHVPNTTLLTTVVEKLIQRTNTPFKLVFVGAMKHQATYDLLDRIPNSHKEVIDYLDWKLMPETIQSFDVGVMPLLDKSIWNRSRSSYKLFEYLAIGIPTVSSATGEITNVITDGVDGFLADSEDEWVEKLEQLINDVALRARIGKTGQEMLRTRESFEATVPHMIEIIKHL